MRSNSIRVVGAMLLFLISYTASGQSGAQIYFELCIYHYENKSQEMRLDSYLEDALIPALHALGTHNVGTFKPREGQPGADSMLYVLISHEKISGIEEMRSALDMDKKYQSMAGPVLRSPHDDPAFQRKEVILMKAFNSFPELGIPEFNMERKDRIYELRSYESATEDLYRRKVAMFNEGEAELFVSLGFQPVFFGDVISGDLMPRLIYMTCHAGEEEQKQNWDAFRSDPRWEKMKSLERFANTVSHIDSYMLCPTPYSDY